MRLRRRKDRDHLADSERDALGGACTVHAVELVAIPPPLQQRINERLRERLAAAEKANRHAVELVDRLLDERANDRAVVRDLRGRVRMALERLDAYTLGDGSRRRDVLVDLEDILG